MLKFQSSVTLGWKYFYRIGSLFDLPPLRFKPGTAGLQAWSAPLCRSFHFDQEQFSFGRGKKCSDGISRLILLSGLIILFFGFGGSSFKAGNRFRRKPTLMWRSSAIAETRMALEMTVERSRVRFPVRTKQNQQNKCIVDIGRGENVNIHSLLSLLWMSSKAFSLG